ncbi:MAG: hypothetical protein JWN64_51 [Parcubacteria group bacterium]|nr:hypothetical protein [Parcubacteria group bacterium]
MATTTKMSRITSKGQVTLPVAWRRKVKADTVVMREVKGVLEIRPARISSRGDLIVFNADRDNGGKGIPLKKLIKILESLND